MCQHFGPKLVPTDNFPLLLICVAFTNSVKLSQCTYLIRFLLELFDYFKLVFVSKKKPTSSELCGTLRFVAPNALESKAFGVFLIRRRVDFQYSPSTTRLITNIDLNSRISRIEFCAGSSKRLKNRLELLKLLKEKTLKF